MIAYKTSKNARVLFVGINPHPGSYRRGVPFSNNKMFWYLLNRSGLLVEAESDLKDDRLLKRIYDKKFLPKYGLNFLNLVDRPTVDVTQLEHGEEQAGIRQARKIILACKPRVVCFIGKIAFNKFYGSKKCEWGWQVGINDSRVYLMHFPIRGPAEVRVKELREVKEASEDQKLSHVRASGASEFPTTDTRVSDDRISNGEPIVLRNRHQNSQTYRRSKLVEGPVTTIHRNKWRKR